MGKQRDCNRSIATLLGGGKQRICSLLIIVFVVFLLPSNAFQTTQKKQSTQTHQMIGVFGGGGSSEPQLPSDVKDAISKCRGAVQKGLEDRISRMVSEHIIC